ncbi:recombination factor protein RarA [Leifsonia xyli subsp. cynodontis DSM 46306]|uniref:Uncharacterized protein n=1 Tax=Leifsonia xyli subsp. cynodontis DSM 46306 TaxID=1389489 RepID=U3P4T9_LEIXC|nr:recombination factor protein RarA [Leifsonia xyli subsp. cynodontis DSM 46306]
MGGLLALALVLAPASAANAIYEGNELHGTLSRATVKPLEVVTYTADPGTYDANEEVSFTIGGIAASTITTVSTVSELSVKSPAEADGSLVFSFYPEAGDKDYTFTTYRADGRVWDELGFTVLGNAAVVDGVAATAMAMAVETARPSPRAPTAVSPAPVPTSRSSRSAASWCCCSLPVSSSSSSVVAAPAPTRRRDGRTSSPPTCEQRGRSGGPVRGLRLCPPRLARARRLHRQRLPVARDGAPPGAEVTGGRTGPRGRQHRNPGARRPGHGTGVA